QVASVHEAAGRIARHADEFKGVDLGWQADSPEIGYVRTRRQDPALIVEMRLRIRDQPRLRADHDALRPPREYRVGARSGIRGKRGSILRFGVGVHPTARSVA